MPTHVFLLVMMVAKLISKFRYIHGVRGDKFTITYVVDLSEDSAPLSESELEEFMRNGHHPRLMMFTLGPSILLSSDSWLK